MEETFETKEANAQTETELNGNAEVTDSAGQADESADATIRLSRDAIMAAQSAVQSVKWVAAEEKPASEQTAEQTGEQAVEHAVDQMDEQGKEELEERPEPSVWQTAEPDQGAVAEKPEEATVSYDIDDVVVEQEDVPPRRASFWQNRSSLDSLPSFDDDAESSAGAGGAGGSSTDGTVIVTHTVAPLIDDPNSVPAVDSLNSGASFSSKPIAEGVYSYETPFSQEAAEESKGQRGKVLKRMLIGVGALAVALALVYVAVSVYFTSHFLPNTTVNGEDVSGMSITDLSSYVSSIGENYKTQVVGDGIDLTIPARDINFVYDGGAYSAQAAAQIDPWTWPLQIGDSHAYVVDKAITFDADKLNELAGTAVDDANVGYVPPTNATMTYEQASSKFVVVPDALGTAVDRDKVLEKVNAGVATMQTEIALADDELVQPSITKDNEKLLSSIEAANKMLDNPVKLRIANTPAETTIDRNLMASWFSLDGDYNIAVNQEAIKEWAQGPLSEQFDSVGKSRTFTRADGKQITVEGGDIDYNYGWSINGEELAKALATNLNNHVTDSIDMPMLKTAASWTPGGKDWPNRYVDVDLSEQYVRMYDDANNVIWESDCVSGNPIYGGGTDTGVFYIYMKSSPMELVGLDYNGDGEPDYRTWVTYWMPFDGGEGLHDMSSRYAFGGSIYTYDGSHGCVNLPYYAAEELYGLTQVGDAVVVHW